MTPAAFPSLHTTGKMFVLYTLKKGSSVVPDLDAQLYGETTLTGIEYLLCVKVLYTYLR